MYSLFRSIFCIFLFVVLVVIFKKANIKHKKRSIIIAAVSCLMILNLLLFCFPFENFFAFSSPENVYKYKNTFNKGEVISVINAEKSDIVITKYSKSKFGYYPVPKKTSKWEIDPFSKLTTQFFYSNKDVIIEVEQYKKTGECFVLVYYIKEDFSPNISDNHNNDFVIFKGDEIKFYYYGFAYIRQFSEDYSISINGIEICANDFSKLK